MKETVITLGRTEATLRSYESKTLYTLTMKANPRKHCYCSVWLRRRTEKSKRWHLMIYVGDSNLMVDYDQDRRFTANTPEEAVHKLAETLQELGETFIAAADSTKKEILAHS